MVALAAIVTGLLLSTSVWSSPVAMIQPTSRNTLNWLCKIPIIQKILCACHGSSPTTVTTSLGTAEGISTVNGAHRFFVRYGTAARWAKSNVATSWVLPNGANDPSTLPLACPQANIDSNYSSEDCLSMILHVPDGLLGLRRFASSPVLVWIHGGSFIAGSATGVGLDGSLLALATNSVVAVVQYRLGALGFMAPSGATNLAVRDVMTSLEFLQKIAPNFGGDPSKITIAGQSSGAHMIRSLLATPSASSLFKSAILQSDPMDYGFLTSSDQSSLQNYFNGQLNCSATDADCQNNLSLDDILSAQDTLYANACTIVPVAGQFEPIRPVFDGTLLTSSLDSTTPFPPVNKPILLSTVSTEAGPTIYSNFRSKVTPSTLPSYETIVSLTFGDPRTDQIMASPYYRVASGQDARPAMEQLGTDYLWRCSGWTFARNWVQHGGNAFVGIYTVGSTYPSNADISFCFESGSVCHEDDIQIVFGTAPNPTTTQSNLIKEIQARYAAFLISGKPNPPGFSNWLQATTTNVNAKLLGSSGEAPVGACEPSFWGGSIQYDYQFYAKQNHQHAL